MKAQFETELPPYVQPVGARGRIYYYFRRGDVRIKLPGRPGTREFQNHLRSIGSDLAVA